ncbi:MAG: hypothetical protein RLO08_19725 [Parvibaculaceae bacterium]
MLKLGLSLGRGRPAAASPFAASPNLYTGQPWSVIAGVVETPTHLTFDGTQLDGSLAVRLTGLPMAPGDLVLLGYEIENRTQGTVALNASLNATPDETLAAANGAVEDIVTVGDTQPDRLIFVTGGGFDGDIPLASLQVRVAG